MTSDIPSADRWGPWAAGIDDAERRARLRCLQGLARVIGGPAAAPLCAALHDAEEDDSALAVALVELRRLPSRVYRAVLSTFGAIHCPAWNA